MPGRFLLLFILFLLSGCATTPEPLRGTFTPLSLQQAQTQSVVSQRVRWGGEIIATTPGKTETCFEVLARPLDDQARPITGDSGQGRFIACAQGFYDPEVYAKGRELTVAGTLSTPLVSKIGAYDYRYARVSADNVYLWPQRPRYTAPPYYYDPFYGPFYDPFWPGPFRRWPYW